MFATISGVFLRIFGRTNIASREGSVLLTDGSSRQSPIAAIWAQTNF